MARPDRPDLLIIGDSHSVALKAGCDAHGLRAELMSFSGNLWHEGHIYLHGEHGLWARGKANQARILAMRERLGGRSLLEPDLPVLASIGFHLGRMVPLFGYRGHVTSKAEFVASPERHFVSSAFVAEYADQFRLPHIRLLRRMARRARVMTVAPPDVYGDRNYSAFMNTIATRMSSAGLSVYDSRDDFADKGSPLPEAYLADDRVHGNALYGTEAVGHMLRRGLIARPA